MIFTKRIQVIEDLHPTFRKWIGNDLLGDPIRSGFENLIKDESGEMYQLILITETRVFSAAILPDGGGLAEARRCSDVVRVEEKQSRSGKYFYVEIYVDGASKSFRFDFATPEEVSVFAKTVRNYCGQSNPQEGEKKMSDNTMQDMFNDIRNFFEKSQTDDAYNARLARPYIQKWKERFGLMAAAWVATRIQQQVMLPDRILVQAAMGGVGIVQSLMKAYGNDGPRILLTGVISASDEDVLALDAYMLASKDYADPKFRPFLEKACKAAIGTGCKMSLAFALHRCGDSRELRHFVDQGYFGHKSLVAMVRSGVVEGSPSLTNSEIEMLTVEALTGDPNLSTGVFPVSNSHYEGFVNP